MKHLAIGILIILTTFLILSCSSDPVQKGDEAFQKQEYTKALKYYLDAYRQDTKNPLLKEKIARTYFKQGEQFYRMRRVLNAFQAKVDQGLTFLPDTVSENTQQLLSEVYLSLGKAYIETPPENIIQKREYYDNAAKYLQKALHYNPQNAQAQAAWEQFIEKNFSEMYNKGMDYFKRGKTNKSDLLIAEYYLTRALELKPDHLETYKALMTSRKKTLNLLDPDQELPFAVTDRITHDNNLSFLIVIHNNTDTPYHISADNFYLMTQNGSDIQGSTSKDFTNALQSKTLKTDEELEGVVTFNIKGVKGKITRIEYRIDGDVKGYKNLPY